MALAPAPRRSTRVRRPLPQPADGVMPSTSAPRRSARARGSPPVLADSETASTPARRWTARAQRPLPPPSDRAMTVRSARWRSTRGPAAQTIYPEEIWVEIFLHLDAAADLTRVSAACSTFRRIISERWFLRRFRSLYSPPVLGFMVRDRYGRHPGYLPVGPPHRTAPDARALVQAADFTFPFLPDPQAWRWYWRSRHAYDGRILLGRCISIKPKFRDFLVCDPLYRRYVKIPRIPDELVVAFTPFTQHVLPVLAPAGEGDEEESFRVICTVQDSVKGKVAVLVFSSCNQTWRGIISPICPPNGIIEYMPFYAHGCLYWMFSEKGDSLMLNTSEMEFSIIELPPHNFHSKRAIVEAADGRLGFLTVGVADCTVDLYFKNWQSNGVGAQEWLHDKTIPLPKQSGIIDDWEIEGTAGRYLALASHGRTPPHSEHFVLDVKTLIVEKLCASKNFQFYGFPYARFPPPLALPSI